MGECIIPRTFLTGGDVANSSVIKFGNTDGRYDPSVDYIENPTFGGNEMTTRIDSGETITGNEVLYINSGPLRVKLKYLIFYIEIITYESYFVPIDTYGLIGQLVMGETLNCEPIPGLQLKFYIENGATVNGRYDEYYCRFCSEMTNNTDYKYVTVNSIPPIIIYYGDYESNQ